MSPRPLSVVPMAYSAVTANPGQRLALAMGVALVFLRFSMLHQLQTYLMGFNMRLLYLVGIPAFLGLVAVGGIPRSLRGRPVYYWLLFTLWLFPATAFSSWKGGSYHYLTLFLRTNLPMLFVIAGLAITWRDCTLMMRGIAWAAAVVVLSSRIFDREGGYGERLGLDFGSIGNPNDLAGHLLLALPFLLWVMLSAKNFLWRLPAAGVLIYGILVVLKTGSRGALLGLLVAGMCFFLLGTARQRIVMAILLPLIAAAALSFVPRNALQRMMAFRAEDQAISDAAKSTQNRTYLLRQSIRYTLEFPLFGVGPAQFSSWEGQHNRVVGERGLWHQAHNTYTQISSECGIPALLFFLAAIGSTFRLFFKTYRLASATPGCDDMVSASRCVLVGFTGFCTAITFLNFGYFFYLPAMGGLAISMWGAAEEECRVREAAARPQEQPAGIGFRPGIRPLVPVWDRRRRPAPGPITGARRF